MHAELARDEEFVRRFIGEAKSVARLSHQNVVAVFDQGADGPFLYLAMEYVPGPHAQGAAQGQRAVLPRDGAGDHGRRARRARGRARVRDRAPRRQAGERPADRRRPDQGGRLRPGPGPVGGRAHPGRPAHRHGRLRAARAGDRRQHGPGRGRLLGRGDALRAAHRPAAVHRRHPALRRLPARQLRTSRRRPRWCPASPRRSTSSCSRRPAGTRPGAPPTRASSAARSGGSGRASAGAERAHRRDGGRRPGAGRGAVAGPGHARGHQRVVAAARRCRRRPLAHGQRRGRRRTRTRSVGGPRGRPHRYRDGGRHHHGGGASRSWAAGCSARGCSSSC